MINVAEKIGYLPDDQRQSDGPFLVGIRVSYSLDAKSRYGIGMMRVCLLLPTLTVV